LAAPVVVETDICPLAFAAERNMMMPGIYPVALALYFLMSGADPLKVPMYCIIKDSF
jgi:hypothetical protein